jgi:hypothetical protein
MGPARFSKLDDRRPGEKQMNTNVTLRTAALAILVAGCGGTVGSSDIDSDELLGKDDDIGSLSSELSVSVPIGSTLAATTSLNLRSGPSTGYRVLHVIPSGGRVYTVNRTTPSNGWYNIKHNGVVGWSYGGYLKLVSSSTPAPAPSGPRDAAITRAKQGVGFSYWWGHGRWLTSGPTSSTKGYCSGGCPNCSHSGSYGADCSGYVAKIWQVPSTNTSLSTDSHPYSTFHFDNYSYSWHTVARSTVRRADAMVYNANGAGHIFLFESGDGWGSMWAYEAKGCSYGIVHNLRTTSSSYKAIARNGW